MSRPSDYVDSGNSKGSAPEEPIAQPQLGVVGWVRWFWRQLTSMRTALLLLLLLAIAAIPGSLVPQRSSDPNGVTQYFADNPQLAPILDNVQMFDVYSSAWFSSIYLLLFISLIGCIIPRTKHHFQAMRQRPPRTPVRLERLDTFTQETVPGTDAADAIDSARGLLKRSGYRVELYRLPGRGGAPETLSVSAERGYMRETGNLVFHSALVGVLVAVGLGGGFGFAGQKVVVEGQSLVNTLLDYNSFNPGRFFDSDNLSPFAVTLDSFEVSYEQRNLNAYGQPIDFTANVNVRIPGQDDRPATVKVNEPLAVEDTNIYLLGNGYAPSITVKAPDGTPVFSESVPFLPQDTNLTSLGVIKVPDGLKEQVGMIGFFYPTAMELESGAFASNYPDLVLPKLMLNVYQGDLGINDGVPRSVYTLDTDDMMQIAGGASDAKAIDLMPGQTAELPNGLGTVTFNNANPKAAEANAAVPGADDGAVALSSFEGSVPRFASFDVHHDPSELWVLIFAVLVVAGLMTSLLVPRRRVWVKAIEGDDGALTIQYAGLARGEDPKLAEAIESLAYRHGTILGVEREIAPRADG